MQALWHRLHELEQQADSAKIDKLKQVRNLLAAAPIDATAAGNLDLQTLFSLRIDLAEIQNQEQRWRHDIENRYAAIEKNLAELQ